MRNKALVVFGGKSDHPLAPLLKEGFHHCFVAVLSEGYWITVDNVLGHMVIKVVAGPDEDLSGHYRRHGYTVVETTTQKPDVWKFNPFYGNIMVANCVGLVKSVLSMNSLVWTPYSLYKELTKS